MSKSTCKNSNKSKAILWNTPEDCVLISDIPLYRLQGVTDKNIKVVMQTGIWVHYPSLMYEGWCLCAPIILHQAVMSILSGHQITNGGPMLCADEPPPDSVMGCIFGIGPATKKYGPIIKPLVEKPKRREEEPWYFNPAIPHSYHEIT